MQRLVSDVDESEVVTAAFPRSCGATIDVWRYPAGDLQRKRARPPKPDRRNDQRALEVAPVKEVRL